MNILITGTSGFIGSKLLYALCSEYGAANVTALSSRNSGQCTTIVYDPNDYSVAQEDTALIEATDVLVHAGAFIPKSALDVNSLAGSNGNIDFTAKLLKQPFKNLKRIVYLSTIDVYALSDTISESTPSMPSTLYGFSKLYCERMVTHFAAQSNILAQILRVGHVFGPGEEKYSKFLPTAIRSITRRATVEQWGDGSELRSFIFIDDTIKAIQNAIHLPDDAGTINIVGGHALSIRSILDHLISISGKQVDIIIREAPHFKRNFVFDNSKFKSLLLSEETDFVTGLRAEYEHIINLE